MTRLKVPGATLYYEVRGSGPVLLAIPGGPTDAGMFTGLAGLLADRYTVVTYDPRGHSRSTLDGTPAELGARVHAEDAARLLDAVGAEPAYVFGNSGGATIGLDLVSRHGQKVNTLVAHEPPVVELLPDRERWRALLSDIYDTYRKQAHFRRWRSSGARSKKAVPSTASSNSNSRRPRRARSRPK